MARKKTDKWIQRAVKHPGSETMRAKKAGRSLHAQEVHDSHSSNPHIRGKGLLGLRFSGKAKHGNLRNKKKRHSSRSER